uniref:Uncharacterized protein n=1 Tax=Oryza meridionalis TaxID=40149 RepID=A0A0E0DWM3_9ORYZ
MHPAVLTWRSGPFFARLDLNAPALGWDGKAAGTAWPDVGNPRAVPRYPGGLNLQHSVEYHHHHLRRPPPPPPSILAQIKHLVPCASPSSAPERRRRLPSLFPSIRPNHCANDVTQVQGERRPRRLKPRRRRCGDPLHPLQVRPPTVFVDSSLPDRRPEEAVAVAPPFSTATGSLHASSSSPKLRQRTHDL